MDGLFITDINWLKNIENIEQLGDAVLFLLFFIAVLYIFIFAVAALSKRKYVYPLAQKKYRFAVLFSAYKEDAIIVNTVRAFLQQDYPDSLYDIFIVSSQMKDFTNEELSELASQVHVIETESQKITKAKALQKAVEYIEQKELKYDVVVIMDANNRADANFLNEINNAFYSGCQALQTHRVSSERKTNIAVLDAVSEEINNSIFRKGHTRLGFSSALIGSGMAFEYELFKDSIMKNGVTDVDKQLEKKLLIQNIYIEYLEDVYIYDEKVENKEGFYNQRRKWLATQFSNLFSGLTRLPLAMLKGNWDYCDKLFQWMMPPRIILFGFIILIACFLLSVDWVMSVKWWGLLLLLCISFSIAIPDKLVDHRLTKAVLNIPVLFLLMFFNLFRIRGANK